MTMSAMVKRPVRSGQLLCALQRQRSCQLNQVRTIIMTSSKVKRSRPRYNNNRPNRHQSKEDLVKTAQRHLEVKQLNDKLKKIQEYTKRLKMEILKADESKIIESDDRLNKPIESTDSGLDDDDAILNEIRASQLINTDVKQIESGDVQGEGEGEVSISLFDKPANGIEFTERMNTKLGDSIKLLSSKEYQNWNLLISTLRDHRNGFKGLSASDIINFVSQIPKNTLTLENVENVHAMWKERGITYNKLIYNFLLKNYASLKEPIKAQAVFDEMISNNIKPSLYTFGHLIKAYQRSPNLQRINLTLNKMQELGMEPGLIIYTTVLRFCVKQNDVKQAESIFQMMKFRSLESKPDLVCYNIMLESALENKSIFKAIDLYNEMLAEKITPDVYTFELLAKTCSKSSKFLIKGWRFISEIHKRGLSPTIKTFEAMMRLAGKDGDLELSRALYLKISEIEQKKKMNFDAFIYLLLSYRDFKFDSMPQIMRFQEGLAIRNNALELVNFNRYYESFNNNNESAFHNPTPKNYPPFLPLKNLVTKRQILAESNAIWSYEINKNPSFLQVSTVVTYLSIAIEHGDMDEYMKRLNDFTYANKDITYDRVIKDSSNKVIPEIVDVEEEDSTALSVPGESHSPPAYEQITQNKKLKISRTSEIYVNMLAASRRFKNLDLCEFTWKERGYYRKTPEYQKFTKHWRMELDFRFARELVLTFIEMNLLYDATKIVKSTQNQFNWNYYQLKPLHVKLLEIGDAVTAKEISVICGNEKVIKNY